jgi:hypothetical protein
VNLLVAHFLNHSRVLDAVSLHREYESSAFSRSSGSSDDLDRRQALIDTALHLLPNHVLTVFQTDGIGAAAAAMGISLAPSPFGRPPPTQQPAPALVADGVSGGGTPSGHTSEQYHHLSGTIAQEALIRQAASVVSVAPQRSSASVNSPSDQMMSPGRLFSGISGRVATRNRTNRKASAAPSTTAGSAASVPPVDIFGNVAGRLTRSRARANGRA